MIIVDGNDKIRNVENLQVTHHDIFNKDGEMENVKCVEYTVVGENHKWSDWCDYERFIMANPEVTIGG